MDRRDEQKLDNPVWHSLNETHKAFALTFNNLKCYHPLYCPFGGYTGTNEIAEGVDSYSDLANNFFIVGELPLFSEKLALKKELVCLQMVVDANMDCKIEEDIIKLTREHEYQLFNLVNLVQPGYFKSKTMLLGNYYGIFKSEVLVAVTGERMKMYGFTEISAVVTHPNYTGRGYAKQLVTHTVKNIIADNSVSYLHVAETNQAAIGLYKKLGFKTRRKISFWNFVKHQP